MVGPRIPAERIRLSHTDFPPDRRYSSLQLGIHHGDDGVPHASLRVVPYALLCVRADPCSLSITVVMEGRKMA